MAAGMLGPLKASADTIRWQEKKDSWVAMGKRPRGFSFSGKETENRVTG